MAPLRTRGFDTMRFKGYTRSHRVPGSPRGAKILTTVEPAVLPPGASAAAVIATTAITTSVRPASRVIARIARLRTGVSLPTTVFTASPFRRPVAGGIGADAEPPSGQSRTRAWPPVRRSSRRQALRARSKKGRDTAPVASKDVDQSRRTAGFARSTNRDRRARKRRASPWRAADHGRVPRACARGRADCGQPEGRRRRAHGRLARRPPVGGGADVLGVGGA